MSHKKRRPRPARRRREPAPEGAVRLGHGIHHLVEEEVRRRIAASPGGHLVSGKLEEIVLQLSVDLSDPEAGAEKLSAELDRAVTRYVQDVVEGAAAFRPGRAFCHRCESADCSHSIPPGPRAVFAGYTPTGLPRWTEFGQLCLDLRHPHVERIYEPRPGILTLEVDGAFLKADLLPEFHRSARHHDVAGQVCAGLFPVPGLADGEKGVAITFQAVVTRRSRGRRRVGLNVLGGGERGAPVLSDASPRHKPWRAAVLWAQAQLDDLSRRSGRPGAPPASVFDRRVEGILQGLARRIERDRRGRARRTLHAEERHRSGERPTRKAVDDLRGAAEDACFRDRRNQTLVILGGRGRTHFFAPEGRLVSSVHYPKETVEKKIRLGHWKPAPPDELEALKSRVEETTKG